MISELILARIDKILSSRRIPGLRYIDDYELTFKSEKHALEARSILQEALLEYELDLSTPKTVVQSLPQALEDTWVGALNQFQISPYGGYFEKEIIRFFDRAFELAQQNPREGVLKYAAGRVTKMTLSEVQITLVEDLLMQCAQVEAGALSFVLASMLKHPARDRIALKRRRALLLQIIENHAPQRHSSEVAWALWACIAMKLSIPQSSVRAALGMEDSICALLLLHAKHCKLINEPKALRSLRDEMNSGALYGPRWLLAYEASVKGWFRFRGPMDYVAQDRNFRLLKNAGVSFYDVSKTTLPAHNAPAARIQVIDTYLSRITTGYGSNAEDEEIEEY